MKDIKYKIYKSIIEKIRGQIEFLPSNNEFKIAEAYILRMHNFIYSKRIFRFTSWENQIKCKKLETTLARPRIITITEYLNTLIKKITMIESNMTMNRLAAMIGWELHLEMTVDDHTDEMGTITKVTEDLDGDLTFDIYTDAGFLDGTPLTFSNTVEFIVEKDKKILTIYLQNEVPA